MDYWPLLDLRDDLRECHRTLDHVPWLVAQMQVDTQGHYPPEAQTLTANVCALQELLGTLLTPALQAEIDKEEAHYADEESKWAAHQANNYRG